MEACLFEMCCYNENVKYVEAEDRKLPVMLEDDVYWKLKEL